MGGVGWGRFVAISPLLKNWGSLIEGGVRNKRISNSSLDSGEFTFCGMFKLRAKNNVHHQRESELAKKKKDVLYQLFPIYACPLFPSHKPPEKMSTPILLRTSATDDPLHRPATRKETPHNKLP